MAVTFSTVATCNAPGGNCATQGRSLLWLLLRPALDYRDHRVFQQTTRRQRLDREGGGGFWFDFCPRNGFRCHDFLAERHIGYLFGPIRRARTILFRPLHRGAADGFVAVCIGGQFQREAQRFHRLGAHGFVSNRQQGGLPLGLIGQLLRPRLGGVQVRVGPLDGDIGQRALAQRSRR